MALISDDGVIYPPRTPQEAEARALELRIALHSVRALAEEQERRIQLGLQEATRTALWVARWGSSPTALANMLCHGSTAQAYINQYGA